MRYDLLFQGTRVRLGGRNTQTEAGDTPRRDPIVDLIRVLPLSHGIRPTPANTVDQTTDLSGVIIRLWFVHEELRLQRHRG